MFNLKPALPKHTLTACDDGGWIIDTNAKIGEEAKTRAFGTGADMIAYLAAIAGVPFDPQASQDARNAEAAPEEPSEPDEPVCGCLRCRINRLVQEDAEGQKARVVDADTLLTFAAIPGELIQVPKSDMANMVTLPEAVLDNLFASRQRLREEIERIKNQTASDLATAQADMAATRKRVRDLEGECHGLRIEIESITRARIGG